MTQEKIEPRSYLKLLLLAAFITSPFGGALLPLEGARAGVSYPWSSCW